MVSGVPEETASPSMKVIQAPVPILYCTSKYVVTVPVFVSVTVGVEDPPSHVPAEVLTVPAA